MVVAQACEDSVQWAPWAEEMVSGRRRLASAAAVLGPPRGPQGLSAGGAGPPEGAPWLLQNNSSTSCPKPLGYRRWTWFGDAVKSAESSSDGDVHSRLRRIPDGAPKSVWACQLGAWHLELCERSTGELSGMRFQCGSWRCPTCRYRVAKMDYARILEGLRRSKDFQRNCMFVTLTFDPSRWKNEWECFKAAARCWQNLRFALGRRYGTHGRGGVRAKIAYLQVWERHRSGWPHVHMVIHSPEIAQDVRARGQCERELHGCGPWRRAKGPSNRLLPNWAWKYDVLEELAEKHGFGKVTDVQFPRADEKGLAGYAAKITGELVGTFDQRPVNAPPRFRRFRTSLRFLPPRRRGERYTGRLVQVPLPAQEQLAPAALVAVRHVPESEPRRQAPARGPPSAASHVH